jgi:hypothetical protein
MTDFTTKTDISDTTFYQQRVVSFPIMLVDENSATEYYIGISKSFRDTSMAIWQIRKVRKSGNVWYVAEYPNGDQDFKYIWNNRIGYTYL